MKSLAEIQVNEILAGGYALVDTGQEAHALASAISRHTGRGVNVTFGPRVRVELADPSTPATVTRSLSSTGGVLTYPAPVVSGAAQARRTQARRWGDLYGEDRRRRSVLPDSFEEWEAVHLARQRAEVSGAPEAKPCDDCTTEAATYRAIPVDEATIEFVFLKSRKFRGGPTPAELDELIDDSLAAFPALDYAEVVATRERHKFELSCGDRLRTARTRMAKIRELKGGN